MAKIKLLSGTAGTYAYFCPGCGKAHTVTTKQENGMANPIWGFNGDVDKPTFSPSIAVESYMMKDGAYERTYCHSFIRNGKIEYLQDCDHSLAGKTIEMQNV